jgi:A-macroglobulin TED domain
LTTFFFEGSSVTFNCLFRKIPSGCYEQRLKTFIPNVVALSYLNATKKLSPEKLKLGEDALRTGVEQTLETKITSGDKKGAFSIWSRKNSDESDSIWLTAYVSLDSYDYFQV